MSHDTLIHRLVRPAVRLIARTPVQPDHLTALRFGTAIAATLAFARGERYWLNLGAAVFLLSALLDRADGELARQTCRFSRRGHAMDLVADCTACVLVFIGLGWGATRGPLGWAALVLGGLAAFGAATLFWAINVRAAGSLPRYASHGRVLADPDDGMLALPVLLWCFGAEAVLLPAGIVTPALAVWMLVRWPGWRDTTRSDPGQLRPRT